MKKLIAIMLILVSSQETFSEPTAYEGSLVLRDLKVLAGRILIHQEHDLVLFKSGDELSVFPAHKIKSISFYDHEADINRKFISIQQKVTSFTTHYLYEIVLAGEISVLRRLSSALADLHDNGDGYRYFVRMGEESVGIRRFRAKIFPQLRKTCDSLQKHIRENHLNPNNRAHAILIIDYYNHEFRSGTTVARSEITEIN